MPDPEKQEEKKPDGAPPGDLKPEQQPPGDVLHFTPKALNERLARAQDVARREAAEEQKRELEKQAQELGYANHAAMVEDLKRLKAAPPKPPEQQPKPGDVELNREERQKLVKAQSRILELEAALTQAQDAQRKAERDLRQTKQQSDAADARHALEKSAMRAGITEVDYAVGLLVKAQNGKSQEELEKFDDGKFFEDLREQKPFLFGVETRPARTGPTKGNPPAPGPGKTTQTAADEEQVDARKMDSAAYQARLKALGINPNSQPA